MKDCTNGELQKVREFAEKTGQITQFEKSLKRLTNREENENFHRAMRARLIEKDRNFYLPLFPEDDGFNNSKYFWPVMETKTFRII